MRKATVVLVLMILSLISAAILATVGVFAVQPLFFIFAAWAFVVASLIFFIFTYRMYQRFGNRTRQTNELLHEIKFLQERRYEQLARRLDTHSSSPPVGTGSGQQPLRNAPSEIENINARIQRAERRILGQLENESLNMNELMREVEKLLGVLRDAHSKDS